MAETNRRTKRKRPKIKKNDQRYSEDEIDQSQEPQPLEYFVADMQGELLESPQIIADNLESEYDADQTDPLQVTINDVRDNLFPIDRSKSATDVYILERKNEVALPIPLNVDGDMIVCSMLSKDFKQPRTPFSTKWVARKYKWIPEWNKLRFGNQQSSQRKEDQILMEFWKPKSNINDHGSSSSLSSSKESPTHSFKTNDSCELSIPESSYSDSSLYQSVSADQESQRESTQTHQEPCTSRSGCDNWKRGPSSSLTACTSINFKWRDLENDSSSSQD